MSEPAIVIEDEEDVELDERAGDGLFVDNLEVLETINGD